MSLEKWGPVINDSFLNSNSKNSILFRQNRIKGFIQNILNSRKRRDEEHVQDLKDAIVKEFSGLGSQKYFFRSANSGLWNSEKFFIEKYFCQPGKLLDIGCGTGRTSLPLSERWFQVTGIDFSTEMINAARRIAIEKCINITYMDWDAARLDFPENSLDYVFFSNQGWAQNPSKELRMDILREVRRVLRDKGIFIFTTHERKFYSSRMLFWIYMWIKLFIIKPTWFEVREIDYWDLFFKRIVDSEMWLLASEQFMHIPTIKEVKDMIKKSGLTVLEINNNHISETDSRDTPPVFYVCKK